MTRCSVLGGPFALVMQGVLFFLTCTVLIIKKTKEASDRTWFEFGLDSSKQLMGAGWIHVANLLCAIIFATTFVGVDGCTRYAANIIVDTTVGVFVEWLLLRGVHALFVYLDMQAAVRTLDSGKYHDEQGTFKFTWYALQMIVWLSIVTLMKVGMVAFMRGCPVVVFAINKMLAGFEQAPKVKLFVVMIIVPLVMNTFQFVVTDTFIKKKKRAAAREFIVKTIQKIVPGTYVKTEEVGAGEEALLQS